MYTVITNLMSMLLREHSRATNNAQFNEAIMKAWSALNDLKAYY